MPYCPRCRDEYVEGVPSCPDCEVDLVEELPPEGEPVALDEPREEIEDAMPGLAVARLPELSAAESLVALLLAHGVPARIGPVEDDEALLSGRWPVEVPPEFERVGTRLAALGAEASEMPEVDPDDLPLLETSLSVLRKEGESAVAGLVRLLVRGRGEVVTRAATLLAKLEGEGVAALGEALVEAVGRDSPELAGAAVKALRNQGRREPPPGLVERTVDDRMAVRVAAIRALAGLGGASSVPPVVGRLRDEEAEVREEAADALWELSGGRIDLDLDRDPELVEEDIRILEEHHGG